MNDPVIQTSLDGRAAIDAIDAELISDKSVEFTQKKAEWYCGLPVFNGERNVTDGRVQTLYDEMARRNFNFSNVNLASCELDGVIYKINGQHTCWAFLYYLQVFPKFAVRIRELRYKVHTIDQLRRLYSTFDRNAGRTPGHLARIQLADIPATEGIWPSLLTVLAAGLRYWLYPSRVAYARVSPEELTALVRDTYSEIFHQIAMFAQQYHDQKRVYLKRAVVAAMFETFSKVPTKAAEFWVPVATGLNLAKKTDARWMLRELLVTSATRQNGAKTKRQLPDEEVYKICIQAWNHWRTGGEVKGLRATKDRVKAK